MNDDPVSVCPKCGGDVEDLDECGYCSHPDSYDGACRHCGAADE